MTTTKPKTNRTLWVLLAVSAAPVIASYVAYYALPPQKKTNYGELITPTPVPDVHGIREDGHAFSLSALKGKWVLLHVDASACAQSCQRKLYATRQARTLQNTEAERIVRVWLIPDAAQAPLNVLALHPGLEVAHSGRANLQWLPTQNDGSDHVYLIDPLGNLMMRFPADPDIKAMNKDLARLLKASRIG